MLKSLIILDTDDIITVSNLNKEEATTPQVTNQETSKEEPKKKTLKKKNTATTATKEAELNTGLVVRVPLFINEGDVVIVSTKDGKYVSRK